MRILIAPIIVASLIFAGLPAFAQSNPSASQIIKSLQPTGNDVPGGTRGIRLAPSNEAPASTTATPGAQQPHIASNKPATPSPRTQAGGPAVNLTVNFETGSAELTPEAIHTLDQLGQALSSQELAAYRFRIEGHTDTVGTPQYNQALSERRAEAVVKYIAEKYGVRPSRMQAVGKGEQGLLVSTPPQTPEPRNRRVEVINIGT